MDALSHRKVTTRLRLIDSDGALLANRAVTFDQATHDFLFGCGACHSNGAGMNPAPMMGSRC